MTDLRACKRMRPVWTVFLIGLGVLAAREAATAQDTPDPTEQIVASLKSFCESDAVLRGTSIQKPEFKDGTLTLSGTIDRQGHAVLIEAEAKRLLDASPSWRAKMPGGVSAKKLVIFPLRSEFLPKLRLEIAKEAAKPPARPGLLEQTRIDDLYFDAARADQHRRSLHQPGGLSRPSKHRDAAG